MQNELVPQHAKLIPSHLVYKVKREENGKNIESKAMSTRQPRQYEKTVRKDSATAQFDVIRLFCILSTILHFRSDCLDIQDANLQSGPIQREILVR